MTETFGPEDVVSFVKEGRIPIVLLPCRTRVESVLDAEYKNGSIVFKVSGQNAGKRPDGSLQIGIMTGEIGFNVKSLKITQDEMNNLCLRDGDRKEIYVFQLLKAKRIVN